MYGGRNVDGNGMELLDNPEATTNEMFLYNINEFDPKDEDKVFVLMRSVHHQFARHLMELFPYDRNSFLSISRNKYIESTTPLHGSSKERRMDVECSFWPDMPIEKAFYLPFSSLARKGLCGNYQFKADTYPKRYT